jgi:predicted phage-related endonuclease
MNDTLTDTRPIPSDRGEWLKLRQRYVGASEVAALFQAQPDYALGHLALWMVKAGRMEPPVVDNPRTRAGLALEDAIAALAADQEGWNVQPGVYASHACGLGATLDRIIAEPGLNDAGMVGPGVLELKNVDWIQHKRGWTGGEPPMHILLQLQAQLLCTGYQWGAVAALVGGNAVHVYRYTARYKLHADMVRRVAGFWASIERGQAPNADASSSAWAALTATTPDLSDDVQDVSDDAEANTLAVEWLRQAAARKAAEKAEAAAKHALVQRLGSAGRVQGDGWKLTISDVPETPDRIITADMIGQTIKGRAGSRRALIKEIAS